MFEEIQDFGLWLEVMVQAQKTGEKFKWLGRLAYPPKVKAKWVPYANNV